MRVLIFHGYLLRGTGSNVYNAELAQALKRAGHDVHLLCQDRRAGELPWVDAVGEWPAGSLEVTPAAAPTGTAAPAPPAGAAPAPPPGAGSITAYVPDIGGLLPVFVYDHDEGFAVKTFPDLSEAELERYLAANVAAVTDVVAAAGAPEAALANHLVMGPVILARAGLRFAAKIHGSDLSYTVRPHPERFVPYAQEGMRAASAALVGSSYTAIDLWDTVGLPDLEEKTRLGPPGLDPVAFDIDRREGAAERLHALAGRLATTPPEAPAPAQPPPPGTPPPGTPAPSTPRAASSAPAAPVLPPRDAPPPADAAFGRDLPAAAAALDWYAQAPADRVLYVGKLLPNKGVDLLLAAWPLIHAARPGARLLLAGFGSFRLTLERLWQSLEAGDLKQAAAIAAAGAPVDAAPTARSLSILAAFLADPPAGYADHCRQAAGSLRISGRLEHPEVAAAILTADTLVMPSTFPEAFGMVAAEAAAAGALPISANHSGMAEVAHRLGEAVAPEQAGLLSFELTDYPIRTIAANAIAWLQTDPRRRAATAARISDRAIELWSWAGLARTIIAASSGDLTRLDRPRYIV